MWHHILLKLFPLLTCPGWCWCCLFCQRRSQSWSRSRSRGRSAGLRLPVKTQSNRRSVKTRAKLHEIWFIQSLGFTFCLLSSLGTCRTNKPSLRELTEIPAEGRTLLMISEPNTVHTHKNKLGCWPLTFQSSVVDALFEFGLLYDNSAVSGEQQLAGSGLVAFSVILGDGHGILRTEGWDGQDTWWTHS